MSSKKVSSITWEIPNFSAISSCQRSPDIKIENGQYSFYLFLEPSHSLPSFSNKCIVIHLRHPSNTDAVEVLCSISIIDRNNDKRNTKVNSMYFTKDKNPPEEGVLYFVSLAYLLDTQNGLLVNDKLTIYCEVEVLGDKKEKNIPINVTKQLSVPQKKTLENYSSLLESGKFSDVVFVVGEKPFKLHKAILAAQSPVFSAMFDCDLEESKQNRVVITDLDVDVFEALVGFIYSGNVDLIDQFALELFVASDKYQLDSLKDICAAWLGSNLTIETVANIFLHADMHTSEDLKSKCIDYVSRNSTEVMASDGWKMIAKNRKSYDLLHELYADLAVKFEKVNSMHFIEGNYPSEEGGLYVVSRTYLLNPKNGLLVNDKLTIHCEVEVLGDENISIPTNDTKQISVPQKKALENYSSLLESGKFSDVGFVVGEKPFKLHKAILAAQSPVFSAMFDSDLEESKQNRVEITDLDVEVFEALVGFIYSGNVDRIDQFALELFVASDKYQLDSLKDMCAEWLGSNLTIETVANILLHADMHTSENLKSKCINYVSRNTSAVVASEGWETVVKSRKSFDLLHELYIDLAMKFEKITM